MEIDNAEEWVDVLGHILAQLTAARARLDVIMGYDRPDLFVGWSEAEAEEYARLSPPELFNQVRTLRAQLAAAEQRVAKLGDNHSAKEEK